MNNEAVSVIITNLGKATQSDLSSKDESMLGLQERAREDLSSNDNADSCGENGIYHKNKP